MPLPNFQQSRSNAQLLIPLNNAQGRINERIEKGKELYDSIVNGKKQLSNSEEYYDDLYISTNIEYVRWSSYNVELLKRIFSTNDLATEYDDVSDQTLNLGETSFWEKMQELAKLVDRKIHRLQSLLERLESIESQSEKINSSDTKKTNQKSKGIDVFVVHGHDDLSKVNLEIFLRDIGLNPIVLHRQADEGNTIIEKFEKYSNVGYAFILLTPDDVAYMKTEETKPDESRKKENRARQNVIFEFGYFVGKLGRSKVCCLYTGDVALPSDISGMIYKRYYNNIEEVAVGIIKDLQASGYAVTFSPHA